MAWCNNYVDEFYIGENCNQKWTTLTFALVASLPGFTLALVVGVTVHLIHTFSKPSTGGRNKPMSSSNNTETMFPGIVFASDVKGRPNGLPPRPTSVQGGVTMPSTQPYSIPENTRPVTDRPTAGNLQVPYSSSSSMRPAAGLWDRAAPRPSNSSYETVLPPSPRVRDSFERPPFGVQQPYSYTAGPGQVVSNPYAKNLYLKEERNPLPDPDQSYNPSSLNYSDRHLGHNPDSRPGFPRAQINRMY
ncbi:uncharacterized protein zgc:158432 [Hoplias malabaricus]|uniref:uncharacterized protein zgc:158432 n=1 Tax=Hoplias malabaricus TaxID=27720 RepID=UPI0034620FB0